MRANSYKYTGLGVKARQCDGDASKHVDRALHMGYNPTYNSTETEQVQQKCESTSKAKLLVQWLLTSSVLFLKV
eukprot:6491418-Amphidinium_carterae.2